MKKAVILLSGGLDSAVTLFLAIKNGYEPHCLIFEYDQRHRIEVSSAKRIARFAGARYEIMRLGMNWKSSSLLDKKARLPMDRSIEKIKSGIPSTYVPARNTVFLSIAASLAESISASAIFIGAHFEDSSGYPDCRENYLQAFRKVLKLGTKRGLEGGLDLKFPLIRKNKSQIIKLGRSLGVPFKLTRSCYSGNKRPCLRCDSCILRSKGFKEAGLNDPALGKG